MSELAQDPDPVFVQVTPTILVDPRTQITRAELAGSVVRVTLVDGTVHAVHDKHSTLWEALQRIAIQP